MAFKTSDVVSPYRISAWGMYPGNWILERADTEQKVNLLFRNFVNYRLPTAVKLIGQLIDTRHVSSVHLPMSINALFLTYVNEQIELYQNQREERNLKVDQKWQEFQMAFANERYKLFTQDTKWGAHFFDELKELLMDADVLAEDFNATISLWLQIISIADIGDMYLAAIYEAKAKSYSAHKNKSFVYTELPRSNLEASFYLILRQLSRDYQWICSRVAQKMQFPEDHPLKEVFHILTRRNLLNTCTVSSLLLNDFKEIVQSLQFLDLTDNNTLEKILARLEKMLKSLDVNFGDISADIERLKNAQKKGIIFTVVSNTEKKTAHVPKESHSLMLPMMEDYQECHLLTDCFLAGFCIGLSRILEALKESNSIIEKHKIGKNRPKLIGNCPSLLPPISILQYDAKISQELLRDSSIKSEKSPKKIKGGSRTQKAMPQIEIKKKAAKEKQEKIQPQEILVPSLIVPLDPLEQLSYKLFHLYHLSGSIPIRQALWHLDSLISMRRSSIKQTDALIHLNATVSSAHKFLEQIYRFRLESLGNTFKTHNLKEYHLALETLPYPDIVKQLYLANHWTRYFYIEKER